MIKKILAIVVVVFLILNLIFLALGKISIIYFWILLGVLFILSAFILKIEN